MSEFLSNNKVEFLEQEPSPTQLIAVWEKTKGKGFMRRPVLLEFDQQAFLEANIDSQNPQTSISQTISKYLGDRVSVASISGRKVSFEDESFLIWFAKLKTGSIRKVREKGISVVDYSLLKNQEPTEGLNGIVMQEFMKEAITK